MVCTLIESDHNVVTRGTVTTLTTTLWNYGKAESFRAGNRGDDVDAWVNLDGVKATKDSDLYQDEDL